MEPGKNTDLHLNLLVLMMLSFILRMGLPQLKFLFIPLFFYFTGYVLYKIVKHKKIPSIKHFLRYMSIYLVLLIFYFIALFKNTDFLLPVKELMSGTLLLILFYYFYFYLIPVSKPFHRVKKEFIQQFIIITVIVALVGLIKLTYSLFGWSFPFSPKLSQNALTSSITSDYNFFSLTVIFGTLTILYQLYVSEKIGRKKLIGYNFILVLFSFVIIASQSRRSFVVLLFILSVIVMGRVITLFYLNNKYRKFFRRNDGFLGLMAFLCFVCYVMIFFTSDQLKRQVLKDNRIYKSDFRIELTNAVNRYARVLGFGSQQMDLYDFLWNQDTKPQGNFRKTIKHWIDSGFLDSTHTSYTLYNGDFSQGLKTWKKYPGSLVHPLGTSDSKAALIKSYNDTGGLGNMLFVDDKDTVVISASVKVIRWDKNLRLQTIGRGRDVDRIIKVPENWENDGKWHRIELTIPCETIGTIPFIAGGGSKNRYSISLWTNFHVSHNSKPFTKQQSKKQLPSFDSEKIDQLMKTDKTKAKVSNTPRNNINLKYSLSSNFRSLFTEDVNPNADYTIRKNASSEIGRKERWKYAFHLFSDYSLTNKLFGNGFSYLSRFGKKFNGSSQTYEYPHNPLISAFLYSGIIGAGIYMFFLVYAFLLYVKNFNALQPFFILFLITALYIIISGNSHFSVPAFVFFSLFPLFFLSLKTKIKA